MITTKEKLKDIRVLPLIKPSTAGELWQGVPHGAFIAAITETLIANGHKIADTNAATSPDKLELVASFRTKTNVIHDLDMCLTLMTSNGRHLSPTIAYGCIDALGYGYAFEETTIGKLYKDFNIRDSVLTAIGNIKEWNKRTSALVKRLKAAKLDTDAALVFLGNLARDTKTCTVKVPWANVAKTDEVFNAYKDFTRWGLYRAFSEVTQSDPSLKQVPRLLLFAEQLKLAL